MNVPAPGGQLVRFRDRDDDDVQVWQAVELPNKRWKVTGPEGPIEWTYATEELEFLGSADQLGISPERT